MAQPKYLALAGAALLAIGVFLPLMSVPFIGNINYFMNGKGDGTIVLGLAAVVALGALLGRYWLALAGGALSLALILFSLVRMRSGLADMQAEMGENPVAELVQATVQMQFGWAVLLIGAVLSMVSWHVARKVPTPTAPD